MLKFFRDIKKRLDERIEEKIWENFNGPKEIDSTIIRFLNKADRLINDNFDLGLRYLRQAHRLYGRRGYYHKIDIVMDRIFNAYMNRSDALEVPRLRERYLERKRKNV